MTCMKSFELAQPARCLAAASEAQSAFRTIYDKSVWVKKDKSSNQLLDAEAYYTQADPLEMARQRVSASGHGSDHGLATVASLRFLREVIRNYSVSSMIDVPCGDANWQFETQAVDTIDAYAGLDIVQRVVDFNRRRFSHHSNKVFEVWDFATCALPRLQRTKQNGTLPQPFELVHSRDVFQHMRASSALKAIHRVVASGARLFIATTFEPHASRAGGHPWRYPPQPHPRPHMPFALSKQPRGADASRSSTWSWPWASRMPGGRALQDRMEAAESPKVAEEGGFAQVNLGARPFVLPPPVRCVATHPTIEPDLTCLYVLTSSWKKEWRARQRRCGTACTPEL